MATHDRKACSANLVLVAPPISNTSAARIASDEQVIEQLRRIHFYMICGRPKATFSKIESVRIMNFSFLMGSSYMYYNRTN